MEPVILLSYQYVQLIKAIGSNVIQMHSCARRRKEDREKSDMIVLFTALSINDMRRLGVWVKILRIVIDLVGLRITFRDRVISCMVGCETVIGDRQLLISFFGFSLLSSTSFRARKELRKAVGRAFVTSY